MREQCNKKNPLYRKIPETAKSQAEESTNRTADELLFRVFGQWGKKAQHKYSTLERFLQLREN